MKVYFHRATRQVCAPTRHNHQFFPFAGFSRFWPKFFKTPCVPDGCIYRSNFFGKETQVPKLCFDAIWGKKIFENFTPKFKGKSGHMAILGPIFKRKKSFFNLLWDIIQAS